LDLVTNEHSGKLYYRYEDSPSVKLSEWYNLGEYGLRMSFYDMQRVVNKFAPYMILKAFW